MIMNFKKCKKESFVVIGKEGSTNDGDGLIQKLWEDANSHFNEVVHLAKKDENGNILGIWGAMSDFSRSFNPWEKEFSQGLYLAGVECSNDAEAPNGWIKWVVPGYEYIYVENETKETFPLAIRYLKDNNISLAGAVHDFICPETGKGYMFFPIRRL
jgi:predicted transcriptional regulator YdeE